jgi:hypothetical protein
MRIDLEESYEAKQSVEFKDDNNITYEDLQKNTTDNLNEIDGLISKLNMLDHKSHKTQTTQQIYINIDTKDLFKINDNDLFKINDNDLSQINKERRLMKYIRWKDTEVIMAFIYTILQSIIICLNSCGF